MAALLTQTKRIGTRGEAEAEIAQAVVKFEREYLGRGPVDARTYFLNDLIPIRLRGVLTAGDKKLAETRQGQALLKETRRQLFETSIPIFEQMVSQALGCRLVSFHTDISTQTGERIIVLTTDTNLDFLFRKIIPSRKIGQSAGFKRSRRVAK